MNYFLKTVGMSNDPLPIRWWEECPEITARIFFGRRPRAITPPAILIYYAVGGDGRLCGVVEVTGKAREIVNAPASFTDERRQRFRWQMPVKVIHKCPADKHAPRLADFQDKRIGSGSYQSVRDEAQAKRMIDAIAACERRRF